MRAAMPATGNRRSGAAPTDRPTCRGGRSPHRSGAHRAGRQRLRPGAPGSPRGPRSRHGYCIFATWWPSMARANHGIRRVAVVDLRRPSRNAPPDDLRDRPGRIHHLHPSGRAVPRRRRSSGRDRSRPRSGTALNIPLPRYAARRPTRGRATCLAARAARVPARTDPGRHGSIRCLRPAQIPSPRGFASNRDHSSARPRSCVKVGW